MFWAKTWIMFWGKTCFMFCSKHDSAFCSKYDSGVLRLPGGHGGLGVDHMVCIFSGRNDVKKVFVHLLECHDLTCRQSIMCCPRIPDEEWEKILWCCWCPCTLEMQVPRIKYVPMPAIWTDWWRLGAYFDHCGMIFAIFFAILRAQREHALQGKNVFALCSQYTRWSDAPRVAVLLHFIAFFSSKWGIWCVSGPPFGEKVRRIFPRRVVRRGGGPGGRAPKSFLFFRWCTSKFRSVAKVYYA